MVTIELEVIDLNYPLYNLYWLELVSFKESINGHYDILLLGEEEDLLEFVIEEHGEDEDFFNQYVNRD